MKKLLLTAAILMVSATSMATNTSEILDGAATDTLTITANYVKPIAVTLDKSIINFGDVYTDSVISTEAVNATVTGEAGETFSYSVTSGGDLALLTGNITGVSQAFTEGAKTLTFNVGLKSSALTEDVSETITISVTYDAIADTTTS